MELNNTEEPAKIPTKRYLKRSKVVLQDAGDLFLSHGYAGVSINAVIAKIGGSKRDLYKEFGDKEGLFKKVIAGICQDVLEPLQALPTDGNSLEDALLAFGRTFLQLLLSPRVVALQKLVMSEASRYPDFVKLFIDHGPSSAYRVAANLLNEYTQRGEICIQPSPVMGALFCDMLVADLLFRVVAGEIISIEEMEARVQLGVATFLNGIRPR